MCAEHRLKTRDAEAGARHYGRCHRTLLRINGSYAVKSEFREASPKITRPVAQRVEDGAADTIPADAHGRSPIASAMPGDPPHRH
jgi:hypothetical protein